MRSAGAGRDRKGAEAPAVIDVAGKGRVVVFAFGLQTSGIPFGWAASDKTPGVNQLTDLSDTTVRKIAAAVGSLRQAGDIVVASIHWGGNWGYRVPARQTAFAHKLINEAGVAIVHGHSSHHPKGIEVYQERPIIYGCGDFLNDYEGISGYEEFRGDLGFMYLVSLDPVTGALVRFEMIPTQIKRFRVNRVTKKDARWLADTISREGARFGTRAELTGNADLSLRWR